jgi:hypothetical protein
MSVLTGVGCRVLIAAVRVLVASGCFMIKRRQTAQDEPSVSAWFGAERAMNSSVGRSSSAIFDANTNDEGSITEPRSLGHRRLAKGQGLRLWNLAGLI